MALPLVPVLLGGGLLGLVAYAASKGGSVSPEEASRVANRGPNGEYVFKPEVADAILKALMLKSVTYEAGSTDLSTVKVEKFMPNPGKSAYDWAKGFNPNMTIMAPLAMGSNVGGGEKLKSVSPGQEGALGSTWAVLLYAGCLAKGQQAPGQPSGGGSISPLSPSVPGGGGAPIAPTPKPDAVPEDQFADLKAAFKDLLANGQDPDKMEQCAAELEKYGFASEAAQLRARAAELRKAPPVAPPVVPPPSPAPTPTAPVQTSFQYNPYLGSVGSGSSYAPGDVSQDAAALNYLGYNAGSPGTGSRGAWNTTFQAAVRKFQMDTGLTADGWIGPNTRKKLKEKVDAKNGTPVVPAGVPQAPTLPSPPSNAAFIYAPNLGSVGSGSSYNPGPVDQDAGALNFLGYNAGSPSGSRGAWDATFQSAVRQFQAGNGLTADGWIGPKTRTVLLKKVNEKNASLGGQPQTSGVVISGVDRRTGQRRSATVVCPSGLRFRSQPSGDSLVSKVLPYGTTVSLVKLFPSNRIEAGSPGPGGWALVDLDGSRGWVVSEWLKLA